jgi:hypothetical protein
VDAKIIKFVTTEGLNQDVLQSYTCLFDEESKLFFVNIGCNDSKGFLKSTFVNSVELAKSNNAEKVYFVVARSNPDKSQYRKDFKLVDLKRVTSDEKRAIFKSDSDHLVYSREIN